MNLKRSYAMHLILSLIFLPVVIYWGSGFWALLFVCGSLSGFMGLISYDSLADLILDSGETTTKRIFLVIFLFFIKLVLVIGGILLMIVYLNLSFLAGLYFLGGYFLSLVSLFFAIPRKGTNFTVNVKKS